MNPEWYMIILPALGWLCWSIGGTGYKWVRRYLFPVVLGTACLVAGIVWWRSLLLSGLAIGVSCLGYGEEKTWLQRSLVALGLSIISIPIGLSWWNVTTGVAFVLLFIASNWQPFANTFTWKLVEGITGCLVGVQVSYILATGGW